jgi:S1-C subfamily serine protease
MKLRRVLLVILLVGGFYFMTQHLWPAGTVAALVQRYAPAEQETGSVVRTSGPLGTFDLNVANAQPAYDAEEQNNIAVYKRLTPSVVNITSTTVSFSFFYGPVPQEGQGSGFILDKQGHILTNNHVIGENNQRVEVQLADKRKYKAQVVGVDKMHDLALLQITAPNLQPVELADSRSLMVGQKVFAIGNPFGLSGTMTRGIISAIRSVRGPTGSAIDNAIQTDASINPGNSGGPLMNSRGQVIGINTMIASGGAEQSAGIGFAIPINTARAVLDDFAKYGHVRRPSLAILPLEIGPDLAGDIGLPSDYGVLVQRVVPGGAAERAGIKGGTEPATLGNTRVMLGGDFIVAIDGQEITTAQDISSMMNSHKTGDVVTVTLFRGRRRQDVKVTLTEANSDQQI